MLRVVVGLCLIGAALCGPPVSRSRSEIEKFRDFLESSRTERGVIVPQSLTKNYEDSPWENSGKYQGDILLDEEQIESMVEQFSSGRNAYILPNTIWPERTIVYEIADGHFDAAQTSYILYTISELQGRTCIRFRRRNPEEFNYVLLTGNPDGCYANVGYWPTRGVHVMNLAPDVPGRGCFNPIVIIHEWLHIIGFFHMHTTYNRDNYVRVNWDSIIRGMEHHFDRLDSDTVSNLGLPYEHDSCMHFGGYTYSRNGWSTIDSVRPYMGTMGQRNYVTMNDFRRVDRHYGCTVWRAQRYYQPFTFDGTVAEETVARKERTVTDDEVA